MRETVEQQKLICVFSLREDLVGFCGLMEVTLVHGTDVVRGWFWELVYGIQGSGLHGKHFLPT